MNGQPSLTVRLPFHPFKGRVLPDVPDEREYPVPSEIAHTLAYDEVSSDTDAESG